MKRQIELASVHIESWNPKKPSFVDDWQLESEDYKTNKDYKEYIDEKLKLDLQEIVLEPNKTFNLIIDYPLSTEFSTELKIGKNGMTRKELVDFVQKSYKQIYKEEKQSTQVKVGRSPGMFNRNRTNGKYGIWGHDLCDLHLNDAYVEDSKITLSIDS